MARQMMRKALNERLQATRTLSALRKAEPSPDAAAGLSDALLAFAAQNPDHSEAGRKLAQAELVRRLGPDGAARAMDLSINEIPTPGFLAAGDVEKDDGVFFGPGRWLRVAAGLAASFATIVSIGFFIWFAGQPNIATAVAEGVMTQEQADAYYATDSASPERAAIVAELTKNPRVKEILDTEDRNANQLAPWIFASWTAFPFWAFVTSSRRKPARILLLRKFNNKQIGRSIEKMSNANLRPYGHVFTLADKHFKRNPLWSFISQFWAGPFTMMMRVVTVPIGMVRRLWDRSRDGPILVWNSNDYRHFAKRLEDRGGLNLEMARTQRKTIMVRTSDDWWQQVVELIMHASDVIVIDLTEVSAGTVWELQKVPAENVAERVVFVVREDRLEPARHELLTHGFPGHVDQIQVYRGNGVYLDKAAFRSAMRAALLRRLAPVPAEA